MKYLEKRVETVYTIEVTGVELASLAELIDAHAPRDEEFRSIRQCIRNIVAEHLSAR